ncbi:MAG: pilus assembly protein [Caldilineaceae bacterium]|nr:pilus assembly protein [Caldilineaceae bacterium]
MNIRKSPILSESGQSLVEFALVAPFLLLITLGILDLGRLFFINTMLTAAAQEGARAGAVSTSFTQIQNTVQDRLSGVDRGSVQISIDRTEEYTEVEIAYTFQPVTPLIGTVIGEEGIILRRAARIQLLGVFIDP